MKGKSFIFQHRVGVGAVREGGFGGFRRAAYFNNDIFVGNLFRDHHSLPVISQAALEYTGPERQFRPNLIAMSAPSLPLLSRLSPLLVSPVSGAPVPFSSLHSPNGAVVLLIRRMG